MYKPDDNLPSGWVKPAPKPTIEFLTALVSKLRAELAQAESQLQELQETTRLEALAKVRNIMRAHQLTPEDLGLTPAPRRRGRPRKSVH